MNKDKEIMIKNKIHEIKYFIRDELTLKELIEIKEVLDDAIEDKEQRHENNRFNKTTPRNWRFKQAY